MHPTDSVGHDEIEWQFDAIDLRPVRRWLAEREGNAPGAGDERVPPPDRVRVTADRGRRIVDLYADTSMWALHRSGYTLRLRARSGTVEATLKALRGARDGWRRRRELTQPVHRTAPDALAAETGPVADRVRAVAGRTRLRPLFEVRTLRSTYRLWIGDRQVAELALDQTTIPMPAGRSPARLRRVEVEVVSDPRPVEAFVRDLQQACRLQPAQLSKFEAGVLAHEIGPPARPPLFATDVDRDGPIGDLAFSVLAMQFEVLLDREPGTRMGDDPEELHDMRVATRRLRAALGLFGEFLPARAGTLREELRWLASRLGEVRDLDVQLEQLDEWERELPDVESHALEPLRAALEARRTDARDRLLEALDSSRYARLTTRFEAFLRHGPLRRGLSARIPSLRMAPELVEDRHRKVRRARTRARKDPTGENLHRLRIRCKRLRYTLEFLTPLYGKVAQPPVRALVKVQDLLGEHQDSVVAMRRLRAMAAESGLPAGTIFVMGQLAERYDARSAKLRRRLPRALRSLGGGKWVRLRRAMERERASVPAPPPSARRHLRAVPTSVTPSGANETPGPTQAESPVTPLGRGT